MGDTVPAPLLARLDADVGRPEAEGFTILVLTSSSNGWPHVAMISVGEVVVAADGVLRLALWPTSTAARNLSSERRGTLAAVVDAVSYQLRVAVEDRAELETPLAGRLVCFTLRVEEVRADEAPYAVLESGVRFRLKDPAATVARWREVRAELRRGPRDRSE